MRQPFLEGFTGLLHTDGYGAYHCKLPPEITVVGCWTHMRRKFTDTLKSLPDELRDRSPAKAGLDFCDKLFRLESGFMKQKLSVQDRYQTRLKQSKPVAEKFFAWAKIEYEKNPVPKSMFGAALTYAVNSYNPFLCLNIPHSFSFFSFTIYILHGSNLFTVHSFCTFRPDQDLHCQQHQLQIQPQGIIFNIIQIQF